jgi:hypothetical protein
VTLNELAHLPIPTFGYTVYVVTSQEDWDEVKGALELTHEPWIGEHAALCHGLSRKSVICINPLSDAMPAELVGLAAHESTHAWQNLCEEMGEKSPSTEFEAYTIQSITQFVVQACWDCQKTEATCSTSASSAAAD